MVAISKYFITILIYKYTKYIRRQLHIDNGIVSTTALMLFVYQQQCLVYISM